MILDWLFGRKKNEFPTLPPLLLGRYSDNNKTAQQAQLWSLAEEQFRDKKYVDSISVFFSYLNDKQLNNVEFKQADDAFTFTIYQGSKIIRGFSENGIMKASVALAKMPLPSVPVMRRLLEYNYYLYYCRFSIFNQMLMMQFESEITTANPNKLYYALKELCVTSDKQDDLLVQDFTQLESVEPDAIVQYSHSEKEIRYSYMMQWIDETKQLIDSLDAEKHGGAVSYLLLALVYRIDYLIAPEGTLSTTLEKIHNQYFKDDKLSVAEKNRGILNAVNQLQLISKAEVLKSFFKSKWTFAVRQPKPHSLVTESIQGALKNVQWYNDNGRPEIANIISEYGISYAQFSFSLPAPLSELFRIYMQVNYPHYFSAVGGGMVLYRTNDNTFHRDAIEHYVNNVVEKWKEKHPKLQFPTANLKYDSLLSFNVTYTSALAELDFEL